MDATRTHPPIVPVSADPIAVAPSPALSDLPLQVIDAFVAGSTEALGLVYDRYSRPVWSVVSKVLGGSPLVEDAVQEAFLRAWRASEGFDSSRPLAPWLFTIARRTAIDTLRKEMRPTRGAHEPEVDTATPPPDFEVLWCVWEVRTAIEQLPPDEAEIVRLAHLDGYTHREISALIDVPVGTVKSRSHRAHRKLAVHLQHLADDGAQSKGIPTGSSPGRVDAQEIGS